MEPIITPYIAVKDARGAIAWYGEHFGAEVREVIEWEGKIGHSELNVAGAVFYLSDEAPDLNVLAPDNTSPGYSQSIVLLVAVADAFVDRATAGGAQVLRPMEESHGARNCWLLDPFGHRWNIRQPVATAEEIEQKRQPASPYYFTFTSTDPKKAGAFFSEVFGWEYHEQSNGGLNIENSAVPFGIRPENNEFSETQPGQIDLWWKVYDFDDTLYRVLDNGGKIIEQNDYDSGRAAHCEDDQGMAFHISEPAPGYDT